MEARDDYWGPKPVAKRIVFSSIPDRQTRLLAAQNGDIDGTFDLAISDIDQWKALGNVDVITAPSLGVFMLTMDQTAAPFDDIHVRKAISYAVDREGLVQGLLKGNGEAATALNPPEMWAGIMSADEARAFYATLPGYQFDLEKAKAELAQSKHPNGFEISVPGNSADPYQVNILQSVSQNLRQIGITMKVQEVDDNTWLVGLFPAREPGHADHGVLSGLRRCGELSISCSTPARMQGQDSMNGSNFKNAEVDKALEIANQKSDPKERAEALKSGVQDCQRRRRAGADLLAGFRHGDQQQVQADRLQRVLVQYSLGHPRLRLESLRQAGAAQSRPLSCR